MARRRTKRAVDLWDSSPFSSIFLDTKESKRQIPFEVDVYPLIFPEQHGFYKKHRAS